MADPPELFPNPKFPEATLFDALEKIPP